MAADTLPNPEELRQLLRYDPKTGLLTWRSRDQGLFKTKRAHSTWNARYADKPAFTASDQHGYRKGAVFDRTYKAHRIAWAIYYGEWPDGEIDHINRVKFDNRITNLRVVDHAENSRNFPHSSANTSGVTGVVWAPWTERWRAQIGTAGGMKHLGYFEDKEEAAEARLRAEAALNFDPSHGR